MEGLVYPKRLSPGDTIAIVAPSEPVNKDEVQKSKELLETLGYKVKLGKHIFYKIGDYTAGTAEDRAEDLNKAFADTEVKAIFMAVGGVAADQILSLLDYEMIAKNPKLFVGYSDATILQYAILAKAGLVSFSGPNGAGLFEQPKFTMANMWQALTGADTDKIEPATKWEVLRSGKGKGMFIGGNLDTICATLGTSYDVFAKFPSQKLLFYWEEFDDEYNRIIRNLFHLKHAGVLERCEGMLVGKIVDCSEEGFGRESYVGVPELRGVLLQMARAYDFPIIWDVDFGHVNDKITLPQGVEGEVDTKTLTVKFKNPLT